MRNLNLSQQGARTDIQRDVMSLGNWLPDLAKYHVA